MSTTIALLILAGMGFASLAGDLLGIIPVINVQGFGYVLAGMLAWLVLRPRLNTIPPVVLVPGEEQA